MSWWGLNLSAYPAVHSHDTSMGTMEWPISPSNGPTGALGSKCQTTKRQNVLELRDVFWILTRAEGGLK